MNRFAPSSLPTHVAATLLAAVVTAVQFGAIEALARQRHLSAHAQVVQLERVIVTGQRASKQAAATAAVAGCRAAERAAC